MHNTARQTREDRTITVDFQHEAAYFQLLGDGKAFVEFAIAFILSLGFQLKHKATCSCGGCLTRHSHYLRVRHCQLNTKNLRVIQFSTESLTGRISGVIKRFDPRGGSPGKARPHTSQNAWMELRR